MKIKLLTILFLASIFATTPLFAQLDRKNYFEKPQIGLWFGPVTPIYTTARSLDADLGGGIFFRVNTPASLFKVGVDTSIQHYTSKGMNEMYLVPVYGSIIFLLPIKSAIKFQFKAGAGSSYVFLKPDNSSTWDPTFVGGFEIAFPAGRMVNIGMRVEYLFLYEKHIQGAKYNGHFISSGMQLYFNINI